MYNPIWWFTTQIDGLERKVEAVRHSRRFALSPIAAESNSDAEI